MLLMFLCFFACWFLTILVLSFSFKWARMWAVNAVFWSHVCPQIVHTWAPGWSESQLVGSFFISCIFIDFLFAVSPLEDLGCSRTSCTNLMPEFADVLILLRRRGDLECVALSCWCWWCTGGSGLRSARVFWMLTSRILGIIKSPLRIGMFCLARTIVIGRPGWPIWRDTRPGISWHVTDEAFGI